MGRKKRFGGAYTIQHAEELFEKSKADGHPDYKYVALAIGSSPAAPPSWALWACIELRQQKEDEAGRGNDNDIPVILNQIVRFYDREQRAFEENANKQNGLTHSYVTASLRSAILSVLKNERLRKGMVSSANDDWFRDIREAWQWEQDNDCITSSYWQLEGWKTTSRIDRVLTQDAAAELGDPNDLAGWAWITQRLIDSR